MTQRQAKAGEVAADLHVSTGTLRQLAAKGLIPSDLTRGGHRRYNLEEARAAYAKYQVRPGLRGMRLYVWTNVLWDYGPGMIVALAPDLDTALALARTMHPSVPLDMGGTAPADVIEVTAASGPRVWFQHGGG